MKVLWTFGALVDAVDWSGLSGRSGRSGRPTAPCRSKLPTLPCRSKLQEAMSDKPGGYVGQGVGLVEGFYWRLVLGAKTLTIDSKMVSLAFL
jgi:hypothetical protein